MGLTAQQINQVTDAAAKGVKVDINVTDDTLKTTGTYLIAAAAVAGAVVAIVQFVIRKVFGSD